MYMIFLEFFSGSNWNFMRYYILISSSFLRVIDKFFLHCTAAQKEKCVKISKTKVSSRLNTSYLTDSYIVFTLKMESVSKIKIFGLKMMVKVV